MSENYATGSEQSNSRPPVYPGVCYCCGMATNDPKPKPHGKPAPKPGPKGPEVETAPATPEVETAPAAPEVETAPAAPATPARVEDGVSEWL